MHENPGAREGKDDDKPWIANYPPLDEWLRKNDARCDWQMKLGKGAHASMLEQWRMPGSLPFIILVLAGQHGWEIYTPCHENNVEKTLEDTKKRIYAGTVVGKATEGL